MFQCPHSAPCLQLATSEWLNLLPFGCELLGNRSNQSGLSVLRERVSCSDYCKRYSFVGSHEFSWAFGCDVLFLLTPFRTLGIITLVSCPGSYLSLWAYRALDPLMDPSSPLPGTFLAEFWALFLALFTSSAQCLWVWNSCPPQSSCGWTQNLKGLEAMWGMIETKIKPYLI